MSCCEPWENEAVGICPECGGDTDSEGNAATGCEYSPKTCETCGAQPCDGSC